MQEPNEPKEPTEELPPMDPSRSAELRGKLTAIATTLLDALIEGQADRSTDSSSSLAERATLAAFRPMVPRLRGLLLSKISASDPRTIEVMMGATATALEGILYYAPGDPLPRFRFDWDASGRVGLVPLEGPANDAGA